VRAVSDVAAAAPTLRIAAHISASEWGGAERRSLVLLAGLAARGHTVRVFCTSARIADRARERGLDAVVSPLRGDVALHHAITFALRLRSFRPDVLILVTFRRLLPGALAARLAGVPRVIARIGLASDVARSAKYRIVLKRWIDDVVVNAESLITPFRASLPQDADVNVVAIPNGVEPRMTDMPRDEARRALGLPADAFVIGSVARLVKQKRLDRLLRAVHALHAEHVHAVVAGAGYERDALIEQAQTLGIENRVHLLGHREDVGTVLRALDLYVVTSDQEGMSSGMLEALAAGVPVLSTPVSGAAEVLTGTPPCGVVVDAEDNAIADGVVALLRDSPRRARLAAAGAKVVRERYGVARMVSAWEQLLNARNY
jgi:glycosyltransferase involved in cell wall biosynthesis